MSGGVENASNGRDEVMIYDEFTKSRGFQVLPHLALESFTDITVSQLRLICYNFTVMGHRCAPLGSRSMIEFLKCTSSPADDYVHGSLLWAQFGCF